MAVSSNIGRQVVKGASWVVAQRFATRGIGLVSTLILARVLAPGDFGLVAVATTLATGFDTLGTMGVQLALIATPGIDRVRYDTAFTLTVIRGVLSGAAVATLAPFVAAFVGDSRLTAVTLVIAATLVVQSLENIGVIGFRKDLRFDKDAMLFLVPKIPAAIVTIAVAIMFHSYWALVAGIVAGRAARVIASYVTHPYRPRFTLEAWRPLVGFSFWIWLAGISGFLKEEAVAFIVPRLLGTAPLGLFKVSVEIATLTSSELVLPICRALFPGFTMAIGGGQNIRGLFVSAYAATMLLVVPAAIGLSLLANPLVRVMLGPNWSAAAEVLRIVALSAIFPVLVSISSMAFLAMGRPDIRGKIGLLSSMVRIALLLVGVLYFGLIGAAWAILGSQIVDAAVTFTVIARHMPDTAGALMRSIMRTVAAGAAMAVTILSIDHGWPGFESNLATAAMSLFTNTIIGAVTFTVVLGFLWIVTGRPQGAETDICRLLRTGLMRIRAA